MNPKLLWYIIQRPHPLDRRHFFSLPRAIAAARKIKRGRRKVQVVAIGRRGTLRTAQVVWPNEGPVHVDPH
ncbi:unnamed protein product [marine sediment metagenome]|uniref:Uncharacterized protein n=1 Tax=marine sediment metagenome TaxID=412755 RepID=X1P840_9ZZZZ